MSEIRTKHDLLSAQSQHVAKKNELIQYSQFSLSLIEQKIVLYMISKIKKDDTTDTVYTFNIKDFCLVCGLYAKSGNYVSYITELLNEIAKKTIVLDFKDGTTLITHWFSSALIDENTDTFQVFFDEKIKPYLFGLKNFYTQYCIEYVLPMKSKFGIRMYELMKSVQNLGCVRTFSISEIRERIDCHTYTLFADFYKNVIQPALNDINLYSDIRVTATPKKTGRKTTHIEFKIQPFGTLDIDEKMARFDNRREVLGSIHGDEIRRLKPLK